jgi:hypothetical protein
MVALRRELSLLSDYSRPSSRGTLSLRDASRASSSGESSLSGYSQSRRVCSLGVTDRSPTEGDYPPVLRGLLAQCDRLLVESTGFLATFDTSLGLSQGILVSLVG